MSASRVGQFAFVAALSTIHFYTGINSVSLEIRPGSGFQVGPVPEPSPDKSYRNVGFGESTNTEDYQTWDEIRPVGRSA